MRLLIIILCCIGGSLAEGAETSSTKLPSTKTSLNAIPSAPAQKTTLIQQQSQSYQQQPQYIPQYYYQKQIQQQQPAAMFIIAQPAQYQPQGSQNPLFQQAVQQLLSYYNNNPQAKYQLLHQQQGNNIAQFPQHQEASQSAYHPQMPTGALRVIPSPHFEAQNAHSSQQQPQPQNHQATYVIPAQSQQILQGLGINPNVLTQLAQSQHNQFASPQYLAQSFPPNHYFQQQHFAAPQFVAQPQYQAQIPTHLPQHIQLGNQFGGKQVVQTQNEYQVQNENQAQTEKSQQISASSNYNPMYRTAYVKG